MKSKTNPLHPHSIESIIDSDTRVNEGVLDMTTDSNANSTLALETIISNAIQLPGVKVNRQKFLAGQFSNRPEGIDDIVNLGPVSAGVTEEELSKLATRLIFTRTSQSSLASFVAGIPGGLAMAATIPADVLQFFGMSLRLAQELSYLYGSSDFWDGDTIDDEKVRNQLILYCGVMFGVSGAVSGVRVLSTQIAKTTLKKLPQKALTKTFWYPIVKQIGKAIGIKVTKTTVAQGISKAVPIIGGVISGTLNYASMAPMANRLQTALNQSCFHYTDEELKNDIEIIEGMASAVEEGSSSQETAAGSTKGNSIKSVFNTGLSSASKTLKAGWQTASSGASSILKKASEKINDLKPATTTGSSSLISYDEKIETLRKLKELVDDGILTQEEFDQKKKEILDL